MTERMENALRHIKSSLDVDPWAVEEVQRVFKAVDDIKAEIDSRKFKGYPNENGGYDLPDHQAHFNSGLICALDIIDRHTGKEQSE